MSLTDSFRLALFSALAFGECAPSALPSEEGLHCAAFASLKQAASPKATPEQRAALYLDAAREASSLFDSPAPAKAANDIYNQAAADLTVLLRSADNGRMWNRPLTLDSGGKTYRLRFAPKSPQGNYDANLFTSFVAADEVEMKSVKNRHHQDGIGGALVGVRKTTPLEPKSPRIGITAPVTAVLDFKGQDVTLSLIDPTEKSEARIAAKERTLHVDFYAPLARRIVEVLFANAHIL